MNKPKFDECITYFRDFDVLKNNGYILSFPAELSEKLLEQLIITFLTHIETDKEILKDGEIEVICSNLIMKFDTEEIKSIKLKNDKELRNRSYISMQLLIKDNKGNDVIKECIFHIRKARTNPKVIKKLTLIDTHDNLVKLSYVNNNIENYIYISEAKKEDE